MVFFACIDKHLGNFNDFSPNVLEAFTWSLYKRLLPSPICIKGKEIPQGTRHQYYFNTDTSSGYEKKVLSS